MNGSITTISNLLIVLIIDNENVVDTLAANARPQIIRHRNDFG